MAVVEVDSNLVQEIRTYGGLENGSLTSLIEDALRRHLFRLRQHKLDQECDFYEESHAQIVEKYLGQYVAIHHRQVVDADADGTVLSKRVRQKFGRVPIAIIHVQETPEWPVLRIRRPRLIGST
ncbi:MAG: hypothetical protein KJZ86_05840 [Caldilineaceae bacterium]|nr:hypothetical protein [Caldilineaceae bacterium]HRJ43260.1 hypothetical protein [Caldilineaceae bacterium]